MRRGAVILGLALAVCAPAHAALPPGFVGLYSDDAYFGDSAYRSQQMALQARIGVQTVRQPFEWWRVERQPDQFDWSAYDGYVADAAAARLSVLPVLVGPPDFRSRRLPGSRSRAMFPPRRGSDFARFVRSAVMRYGPDGSFWSDNPAVPFQPINSWQIWNEPNIPNFWRSGPNAAEYVRLLRAGSHAVRVADPGAEVVAGGLPNSKLGVPFLRFLAGMYKAGAKGMFDTLAIHPYSQSAPGLLSLVERARTLMDRHGDGSRLWITEFGWSTGGDASAFRVSRKGQAGRISEALSGLVAERHALGLRGFVFFKWKDSTAPPEMEGDPWPLHTGLLTASGSAKPGFWAFGRMVHELSLDSSPQAPGSADLAVVSRRTVRLSPRGFAAVTMGCGSGQPGACEGMLRLQTAAPIRCGRMARSAGTQVGSAAFRVVVAPSLVPVRLSSATRTLARCVGRMRVRASVANPGRAHAAAARSVEFVIRAR